MNLQEVNHEKNNPTLCANYFDAVDDLPISFGPGR